RSGKAVEHRQLSPSQAALDGRNPMPDQRQQRPLVADVREQLRAKIRGIFAHLRGLGEGCRGEAVLHRQLLIEPEWGEGAMGGGEERRGAGATEGARGDEDKKREIDSPACCGGTEQCAASDWPAPPVYSLPP